MNRIISFLSGLVLVVGFQNCGKSTFASTNAAREGGTGCNDTTSCLSKYEPALGRYRVEEIQSLTYKRLGQFMVAVPEHHYGVRISFDHRREEVTACPLIHYYTQTSSLTKTSLAYPCGPTFGKAAYEELLILLGEAKLVTLMNPSLMIDGGVATLDLNIENRDVAHTFESSDDRRHGDVVIRDSGALENKLREYSNVKIETGIKEPSL